VTVLRLRAGATFRAFDGCGRRVRCTLLNAAGGSWEARVEEDLAPPAGLELPVEITVAVAPPRGGARQQTLVRGLVELGVWELRPLVTERGVVRRATEARGLRQRWRRWVSEACKQCGRDLVPGVEEPATVGQDLLPRALVLHPGAEAALADRLAGTRPGPLQLLLGPEGGFSDGELEILETAGVGQAHLGSVTLRVETASLAAMTLASAWARGELPAR
jgi:16S rRNA (uracil1498-N3)-methyltransferase